MAVVVQLALDDELELMVWADVALLYPHDYVLTPKRRMVRATENKVHYLISRAIREIRSELESSGKTRDYLAFRTLVIKRLCEKYGFIWWPSTKRVILREEIEDLIQHPMPRLSEEENISPT